MLNCYISLYLKTFKDFSFMLNQRLFEGIKKFKDLNKNCGMMFVFSKTFHGFHIYKDSKDPWGLKIFMFVNIKPYKSKKCVTYLIFKILWLSGLGLSTVDQVLKYTKYSKCIPSTSTGQVLIFLKSIKKDTFISSTSTSTLIYCIYNQARLTPAISQRIVWSNLQVNLQVFRSLAISHYDQIST